MIERFQETLLRELLEIFPVVAVVGPRQVGKTTLVTGEGIGAGRSYLSLDDIGLRSVAQSDPKTFLDRPDAITVDEVQLVPDLLCEIKRLTDKDRKPGRFLLTGSADLDHCADLSAVLAGRVGVLKLPPITWAEETGAGGWREWLTSKSTADLDRIFARRTGTPFDFGRLIRGGFPLSLGARSQRERTLWMESFRMTYLDRDLRRISDIGNLAEFNLLMQMTADISGCLLNQASLARDVGMSAATAGRHLSILEASLLIHRLPPYFANVGKRLVKSPKLYWTDTGLCAHLLGINEAADLDSPGGQLRGRLFETFVITEVLALLPLANPSARLFHLRTHDRLEVDGLIEQGPRKLLFEVKASRTVTSADASPIERWMKLKPEDGPGIVIYAGDTYQPLSANVRAVPASLLFGSS
jgi:uncharacterized protein